MLSLGHLANRPIRPDWIRIIYSDQGSTYDPVLKHLKAFRANVVDVRSI